MNIFMILFLVAQTITFVTLICWHRSTTWWSDYTHNVINDWEKYSQDYIHEIHRLQNDYDRLLGKYHELLKELKNTFDDDLK